MSVLHYKSLFQKKIDWRKKGDTDLFTRVSLAFSLINPSQNEFVSIDLYGDGAT